MDWFRTVIGLALLTGVTIADNVPPPPDTIIGQPFQNYAFLNSYDSISQTEPYQKLYNPNLAVQQDYTHNEDPKLWKKSNVENPYVIPRNEINHRFVLLENNNKAHLNQLYQNLPLQKKPYQGYNKPNIGNFNEQSLPHYSLTFNDQGINELNSAGEALKHLDMGSQAPLGSKIQNPFFEVEHRDYSGYPNQLFPNQNKAAPVPGISPFGHKGPNKVYYQQPFLPTQLSNPTYNKLFYDPNHKPNLPTFNEVPNQGKNAFPHLIFPNPSRINQPQQLNKPILVIGTQDYYGNQRPAPDIINISDPMENIKNNGHPVLHGPKFINYDNEALSKLDTEKLENEQALNRAESRKFYKPYILTYPFILSHPNHPLNNPYINDSVPEMPEDEAMESHNEDDVKLTQMDLQLEVDKNVPENIVAPHGSTLPSKIAEDLPHLLEQLDTKKDEDLTKENCDENK